jgi:hypothetical protein
MYYRRILVASIGLALLPLSQAAFARPCSDVGQGGSLAYLGGDITIVEEVTSASLTSRLGLYSSPLSTSLVDLSSVTPAGTPFIMYNWPRNQDILGQPAPPPFYTVTFNPGDDFGIPVGPIDLGIFVDKKAGYTYFMGSGASNPDGMAHGKITNLGGGDFRMGFEDLFNGGDCDFDDSQFLFSGGISGEALSKVLTSGPDEDGDGEVDLVVTVGAAIEAYRDFTIIYTGEDRVLVVDTVPAEWGTIVLDESSGVATQAPAGKGNPSKSATKITWDVEDPGTLVVDAYTRPSPGGKVKFAPTSCGLLSLNDGAVALQVDQGTGELLLDNGDPIIVFGPTDGINLIAVGDKGVLPVDYPRDGTGDFDNDSLTDSMEVFNIGSDPCLEDTDGDSAIDSQDSAPLDPFIQ